MNVLTFLEKMAEFLTIAYITADKKSQAAYLEWAAEKWPSRAATPDSLLGDRERKICFRYEILPAFSAAIRSCTRWNEYDLPDLLGQSMHMWVQTVHDEYYGLSGPVMSQIEKVVIPRLIERVDAALADKNEDDRWKIFTDILAQEMIKHVQTIIDFRIAFTDTISVQLFAKKND